jgi:hypothetical protein
MNRVGLGTDGKFTYLLSAVTEFDSRRPATLGGFAKRGSRLGNVRLMKPVT